MIEAKRIKYCFEVAPDTYAELIKEANDRGFTCLSKYLKSIILNRHLKISDKEKKVIQELNNKFLEVKSGLNRSVSCNV